MLRGGELDAGWHIGGTRREYIGCHEEIYSENRGVGLLMSVRSIIIAGWVRLILMKSWV